LAAGHGVGKSFWVLCNRSIVRELRCCGSFWLG
jgi:hypothetical protein